MNTIAVTLAAKTMWQYYCYCFFNNDSISILTLNKTLIHNYFTLTVFSLHVEHAVRFVLPVCFKTVTLQRAEVLPLWYMSHEWLIKCTINQQYLFFNTTSKVPPLKCRSCVQDQSNRYISGKLEEKNLCLLSLIIRP